MVTSFYLFPFNLPIQAVVNTKMILAAMGLGLFFLDKSFRREFSLSKDFLVLSMICAVISVWAFLSSTLNRTSDYTFATYIVSVCVWLGGAYMVIWLIRAVHGELSLRLIGNYLVAVCVVQCLLAYGMTLMPSLKSFIDSLMGDSDDFMGIAEGRIYGLGAALDPAGLRFAAILIILTHLISCTDFSENRWVGLFYVISFILITVLGSMVARTTLVGLGLCVAYLLFQPIWGKGLANAGAFWIVTIPILLVGVFVCVWLYNTIPSFQSNLRFGFEGFFSLIEKGRWEVHSTNILRDMVVWPESLRTWIIGDGYFDNPLDIPDQLGRVYIGYYKHTDIGYIRYIFYFGVIGLLGMISAFSQMTITCCKRLKGVTPLFLFLLLLNFIGWLKVSSDIIMVFAPFLILAYISSKETEDEETLSNQSCN